MSHNREYRLLLLLVVVVAIGGLYFNRAFSSDSSDLVSDYQMYEDADTLAGEDLTGFAAVRFPAEDVESCLSKGGFDDQVSCEREMGGHCVVDTQAREGVYRQDKDGNGMAGCADRDCWQIGGPELICARQTVPLAPLKKSPLKKSIGKNAQANELARDAQRDTPEEQARASAAPISESRESLQLRLFEGGSRRSLDAKCQKDADCESSFCSPRGTCGFKFVSEACTKDEQCITLYCNFNDKKCDHPKKAGQPCSRHTECVTGLSCTNNKCSVAQPAAQLAAAKPEAKRDAPAVQAASACDDAKCSRGKICRWPVTGTKTTPVLQRDFDKSKPQVCAWPMDAEFPCQSDKQCKQGLRCMKLPGVAFFSGRCTPQVARAPAPRAQQPAPVAELLTDVPAAERAKWPVGVRCRMRDPVTSGAYARLYSLALFVQEDKEPVPIPGDVFNQKYPAPHGTRGKLYLMNDAGENKNAIEMFMNTRPWIPEDEKFGLPGWYGSKPGARGTVELQAWLKSGKPFIRSVVLHDGSDRFRVMYAGNPPQGNNPCEACKNSPGNDDCFRKDISVLRR